MKRRSLIIIFVAVLFATFFTCNFTTVKADGQNDAEKELNENIDKIIGDIDFGELDEYIKDIDGAIISQSSVSRLLKKLIKGDGIGDYDSVFKYLFSLIFSGIKENLLVFVSLFVILVVCSVTGCFGSEKLEGVGELTRLIGFSIVACIVASLGVTVVESAKSACEKLVKTVQGCFPFLLAFITASGGTAQSAVYSPSTLFIQNFITSFICKITFPCVTTMLALSIISNINKEIKIKGFIEFLSGFMKWVTGLVGAVFTVFTAVKGFSAGVVDGIGIRTLKYAVGSSIPLVGGILSGGADAILSAFILTKNAFGIFMLILIFGAVISPIVETAALTLSLRLLGAITQPITDERTYFFIKSCVSALNHALAGLVLVAVMYAVNVLVMIAASGVV